MAKVYVTRAIPEAGIQKLKASGHDVIINAEDRVLSKEELINALSGQNYDAVLCLLTDKIDAEVFAASGEQCKIFANYAVGFDNIDIKAAEVAGKIISNTPGVLTDAVAEHSVSLMLAVAHRLAEADRFVRAGKYHGWQPMLLLGTELKGKTVGILGLGRIGQRLAHIVNKGFDAKVIYNDVVRYEDVEKEYALEYKATPEEVLNESDYVSLNVPLLDSTRHLINAERLSMMKPEAILVNTARGPVIDESALVEALKNKTIRGAGLDVYEDEPALKPGLAELDNVVLTPHIASGTESARNMMAEIAADNIIAVLKGEQAITPVKH
jgi:lactate dehydrogenase-like 2-hydroxyacid dehydrogenase